MKRSLIAVAVTIAAIVCGIQIASGASAPSAPLQPLKVVAPTGPELPLEQIEDIARRGAEEAGETRPTLAVGKGTLEQAMRTIDPTTTFAESAPGNETAAAIQEIMNEAVTLVAMTGQFTLTNAHVRPGDGLPVGTLLDEVINSRTGAVVGRALPDREGIQEQQGTQSPSMATASTRRAIRLTPVPQSILTGFVTVVGGPPSEAESGPAGDYKVVITRGSTVLRTHTNKHGTFKVNVSPGRYKVRGGAGYCLTQTVTVRAGKRANVRLRCSIR